MFADDDLSTLSQDQLVDELAAQAAHVDAGLARLVALVAECERRPNLGIGTTFATWLAWRCSLAPRQAREHERIAKALAELSLIREAFARGELSYAKVAVVTRIATAESEEQLLELAKALTASQLERAVGVYRRVTREEAAEQQAREFLSWFWTEDGSLSLRGLLPTAEGALLLEALEAGRAALRERRLAEIPETGDDELVESVPAECRVSNAEALAAMADLALAHAGADRTSPEGYQVVVHVDAATLAAEAEGRCELADGRPLPVETARRLSCDGSLVELREHDGEPLSLGRKRRSVSPALRRALASRDRGCRFPGCDSRRFVDAHHLRHWSQGGETKLDNLVSLCRRHHRLVHEAGYSVELLDAGELRFRNQHGILLPNAPRSPPSDPDALRNHHQRLGLTIDADTTRNGYGDRISLGYVTDVIVAIAADAAAAAAAA
jgi:hypothetical protein